MLAIEQFVPGAELVVSDVRIERDEVKLEFERRSPSLNKCRHLEDLLRRFVEIRQP